MNKHAMGESMSAIDNYARAVGATWGIMRVSRDLPLKAPRRKRDNGSGTPP